MSDRSQRGCDFPGCPDTHYGHGLCVNHYNQKRKGQELRPLARKRSRADRFWDRADKRGPDECWPWKKTPHAHGYGTFCDGGRNLPAHRVSYELSKGPIPKGRVIDHKCRNPICVNPDHLQVVTPQGNAENIGLYKSNSSGYRGVTKRGNGVWRARVGHKGKIIHIGDFKTPEEANEAVIEARLRLHSNNLWDRRGKWLRRT